MYRPLIVSSLSVLGLGLGAVALTQETTNTPTRGLHKSCSQLIKSYKEEYGIPGIVVSVSQNGRTVYSGGFGYSDVENCVEATPDSLMRIASISKPLTCTLAAILYEKGKLNIDTPINKYLDYLPEFKWQNKKVDLTCRQLMSHSAGIRHYTEQKREDLAKESYHGSDLECPEFFLNKEFKTSRSAVELFINDELKFEPGKGYLYSTFGYTLLGAVLENCSSGIEMKKILNDLFKMMDMNDTFIDENRPLIANRSKYYDRCKKSGKLFNVPEVDSSYKYAGGGILSTTEDLLKFGNEMLTAYDSSDQQTVQIVKSSTVKSLLWSPQSSMKSEDKPNKENLELNRIKTSYGLGWLVACDKITNKLEYVYHTGGAVGATSCLLIVPDQKLVIAVLCNLQSAGEIVKFTLRISRVFSSKLQNFLDA